MNDVKLMPLLFYDGNFNRDGHRMRAVLEREITDGTSTFRIWRSAGQADIDYPRAENDKHLLYAEINGRLAPLRLTDYQLIDNCGFRPAAEKLYGGPEKRSTCFDECRNQCPDGSASVSDLINREQAEIRAFGSDPARQTAYLKAMLDEHVSTYQKARENGGETFPDFIGALILNELDTCCSLSEVHRKLRDEQERDRHIREDAENKAYCDEKNQLAEKTTADAIRTICEGGVLENATVEFYRDKYDSSVYSVVNLLMRKYGIPVPLRTQGWINDKLSSVTIRDGHCVSVRYLRSKSGQCSQKFFDCMENLIRVISGSDAAINLEATV